MHNFDVEKCTKFCTFLAAYAQEYRIVEVDKYANFCTLLPACTQEYTILEKKRNLVEKRCKL